jgi:hypothetical protein
LEITKTTRVSNILKEYGDIAEVMEIFGVKRVGKFSLRKLLGKVLTVGMAARIHKVPLDEFISILEKAVKGESKDS